MSLDPEQQQKEDTAANSVDNYKDEDVKMDGLIKEFRDFQYVTAKNQENAEQRLLKDMHRN